MSLDTLLEQVETSAGFALVTSYGGYTTNLPLEDLTDGKAWIAFRYDGQELEAEHGGPARLLVPHLYRSPRRNLPRRRAARTQGAATRSTGATALPDRPR